MIRGMKTKEQLPLLYFAVCIAVLGLFVVMPMKGCVTDSDLAAARATVEDTRAKLTQLQAQTEASRVAANKAYEAAITANDQVAAAAAQKQLDDAKKDAAVLQKAQVVNDAASTAINAPTASAEQTSQQLDTLWGLVPAPFGKVGALLTMGALALWKNKKAATATADTSTLADLVTHLMGQPGTPVADTVSSQASTMLSPGARDALNNALAAKAVSTGGV